MKKKEENKELSLEEEVNRDILLFKNRDTWLDGDMLRFEKMLNEVRSEYEKNKRKKHNRRTL